MTYSRKSLTNNTNMLLSKFSTRDLTAIPSDTECS